jgi:hypothetical protein
MAHWQAKSQWFSVAVCYDPETRKGGMPGKGGRHGFEQPICSCNGKLAVVRQAIALTLADRRCTVAIHYLKRQDAAEQVLAEVRERGADGFIVSGDMTQSDDIRYMIECTRAKFDTLDILLSNARPEFSEFYRSLLEMTDRSWDVALDS